MKALFYPDYPFETLFIPHIYKEIYFDKLYDVLKGENLTIVEAGANIGIVTQYLRERGRVYAIEPSPEHFRALWENKSFNQWDNVEVFQFALADKDGISELHRFNVNRTCNSIIFDNNTSDTVTVPAKRLDTFFQENNIQHVDFLKLDVEGAEDMILRSQFPAEKIDSLLVEFHLPTWRDLADFLRGLGYESRRLKTEVNAHFFWRKNEQI